MSNTAHYFPRLKRKWWARKQEIVFPLTEVNSRSRIPERKAGEPFLLVLGGQNKYVGTWSSFDLVTRPREEFSNLLLLRQQMRSEWGKRTMGLHV